MAELDGNEGQATTSESIGTTEAAPQGTTEQSANAGQTTQQGSVQADESFFDPKSIEGKPELQAAYKQMQRAFTKKNQAFREQQKKVEAYDGFIRNPMDSMKQIARQYGYQLVQADPNGKETDEGPKTWDDVYSIAEKRVFEKLEPLLGEVKQMKQSNVETYLDNHYADWRTYEDDMVANLQRHPTLAGDPDLLYQMSVPREVIESRAQKAAMERLRNSSEAGKISGASTTSKTTAKEELPKSGSSFNDFVAYAKAKLAREGLKGVG